MPATVTLQALPEHSNCLHMTWARNVEVMDVMTAFRYLRHHLDAAHEPLCVLVTLHPKTNIPLTTTLLEVKSVFTNPMLRAWLVVGDSHAGRAIAHALTLHTHRHNIYWFNTEAEALAHMAVMK